MESENEQETIEREFSESWAATEKYFSDIIARRWEQFKALNGLIAEWRERGYDKKFRAGSSLAVFILSRSRTHGLRLDQATLQFYVNEDGMMRVTYFEPPDSGIRLEVDSVKLTPEVEDLLTRLLSHPID